MKVTQVRDESVQVLIASLDQLSGLPQLPTGSYSDSVPKSITTADQLAAWLQPQGLILNKNGVDSSIQIQSVKTGNAYQVTCGNPNGPAMSLEDMLTVLDQSVIMSPDDNL